MGKRKHKPKPVPEPIAIVSPKKETLSIGDFYTILALLVGVFLVIVVPPLYAKVPLLIAVCFGFLYLIRRSKWSHEWQRMKQYLVWGATIVILWIIAVPQFMSQWKAEHPQPTVTQSTTPAGAPDSLPLPNLLPSPQAERRPGITIKGGAFINNGTAIQNDDPNLRLDIDGTTFKGNRKGIVNGPQDQTAKTDKKKP